MARLGIERVSECAYSSLHCEGVRYGRDQQFLLPLAERGRVPAWRKQAPPDFVYAVKASRFLSHMKKLRDPHEPLRRLFERARHLGSTLGPILYQLPPHWQVNLSRFETFLSALPQGYSHVVEFRDASWLVDEVFEVMERYGVAHCIHDMRPLSIPARVTAAPVYIRLHGDPAHGGDYQAASLEMWAKRITEWHRQGLAGVANGSDDLVTPREELCGQLAAEPPADASDQPCALCHRICSDQFCHCRCHRHSALTTR